jgi:NADH-quinone oxidoreductase subunit H
MSAESMPNVRAAPVAWLDRIGPAWSVVLAVASLGVIPLGSTYLIGDRAVSLVIADLDASALVPVAFGCLSALGFAAMGWSVRDVGARRACLSAGAQTLSYGVALALAALPLAILHGSLDLVEIAARQDTTFSLAQLARAHALPWPDVWPARPSLPSWGLLLNPLAVVLVLVCGLGALRLPPFDALAADAELRTSMQAEGSGLRLGNAVLADAVNGLVLAGFVVTLGLGGWSIPWLDEPTLESALVRGCGPLFGSLLCASLHVAACVTKITCVFVLIRWLGRRIDALSGARMSFLCFRLMVPLSIVNVFVTGYWLVARSGLT